MAESYHLTELGSEEAYKAGGLTAGVSLGGMQTSPILDHST